MIIKSIGLSKFQYLASLIHIPEPIVSQINSILYEFVWQGKSDKVKRSIFEQEFKNGGFKMANFKDIIKAASVVWVKRYLDDTDRQWKRILEYLCNMSYLNIFLHSNFDVKELPRTLPQYYLSSFYNWRDVSNECSKPFSQLIWYNRDIKIGGHSIFNTRLFSIGLWSISDMYEENRSIILLIHG